MTQNLEMIATHVKYEWKMLRWTSEWLRSEQSNPTPPVNVDPPIPNPYSIGTGDNNPKCSAILESFLLHARNIRDFLCNDGSRHPDDVFASQFVQSSDTWKKNRPPLGSYLAQNRDRLNKMLAHISDDRLGYMAAPKWQVATIFNELIAIWRAFVAALPPERSDWFRDSVAENGHA